MDAVRKELDAIGTTRQKQAFWLELAVEGDIKAVQAIYRPGDEAMWTPALICHASDPKEAAWLREHGAPWDGTFMTTMADNCNLKNLEWGLANYAPIDLGAFLGMAVECSRIWDWAIANLEKPWPSSVVHDAIAADELDRYMRARQNCKYLAPAEVAEVVNRRFEANSPPSAELMQQLQTEYWDSWDFALCCYVNGVIAADTLRRRFDLTPAARAEAFTTAAIARADLSAILPAEDDRAIPGIIRQCLQMGAPVDVFSRGSVWEALCADLTLLPGLTHAQLRYLLEDIPEHTHDTADTAQIAKGILLRGDVSLVQALPAGSKVAWAVIERSMMYPDKYGNVLRWLCAECCRGSLEDAGLRARAKEDPVFRAWLGRHGYHEYVPAL